MRKTQWVLAGSLALIGVHLATPATAATCRQTVSAGGEAGVTENSARGKARAAWTEAVRTRYGGDFAHWHNARAARISCSKESIVRKTCRASARPCKV